MVAGIPPEPSCGPHEARIDELERTLESLREDSEVAHVLLGLSGALAEIRTVDETLEKAVRIVRELFDADRCFAAVWNGANERFQVLADFGFEPALLQILKRLAARDRRGLPLMWEAMRQRAPLLVPDVLEDGRLGTEDARKRRLGAYIGIPLLRWGQDYGGLGIEFSEPRRFTSKDEGLARGIARQVAVALANARRFNLLQTLRRVGLESGSRLRVAGVTKAVTEGALDLLNGTQSILYFADEKNQALMAATLNQVQPEVAEALATIEMSEPTWAPLRDGRSVTLNDLPRHFGVDALPRSMVVTAIPGRQGPMGAIAVLFDRSFNLGPDEAEALNVLAVQSATALGNALRFERQRRVARSLQAGLLRTAMPEIDGCVLAATYHPASGERDVGGDYYDVFDLPDDKVALVVGDVSGKGAEAAAITAMAKYMLRAYALVNPSPSSALYELNNALVQTLEEDRFTTLVYGLLDQSSSILSLSIGGHPPPLLWRANDKSVEILEVEGGIVGAFADQTFDTIDVSLGPDDVVVAFTDGLIEARSADGELYGRERVVDSLQRQAHLPAKKLTDAIYEDAKTFGSIDDDVVVFVLRSGEDP